MNPIIYVYIFIIFLAIFLIVFYKEINAKIKPNEWLRIWHLDIYGLMHRYLIKRPNKNEKYILNGIQRFLESSNNINHKGNRLFLFYKNERFPVDLKKGTPERNIELEEKMFEVRLNDMMKDPDLSVNDFIKKYGVLIAGIIVIVIGAYFLKNGNIL